MIICKYALLENSPQERSSEIKQLLRKKIVCLIVVFCYVKIS